MQIQKIKMKTYNFFYKDADSFNFFIQQNKLQNQNNILIQIFSWIIDVNLISQNLSEITKLLPTAKIIWTTTAGEISNWQIFENTFLLSISVFEKSIVNTIFLTYNEASTPRGDSKKIGEKIISQDTKAIILFCDGYSNYWENIFDDLYIHNPDITIVGWKAWENNKHQNPTYVFDGKNITDKGIVCASLTSPDLKVNNFFNLNWKSIWKDLTITKAQWNTVFEIDWKSALTIYKHYLWQELADSLPSLGAQFPLLLKKWNMEIARAVLQKNEDGSLLLTGNVKEWDICKFGYGDRNAILKDLPNFGQKIWNNPIESIFIYSCSWRRDFLGKDIETEISYIANYWNTSWFFTYSEFFCNIWSSEMLNFSTTILILSESDEIKEYPIYNVNFQDDIIINGLTNLLNTTNEELSKLYKNNINEVREKIKEIEKTHYNFFESYKKVIEEVPAAIWMWDHNEKTIYANKKFLELVEYDLDEIYWWLSYKFWDEDSRTTVQDNNELRPQWETSTYEWTLISKTWKKTPVVCTWIPVHFGTVGMMIDVRDLKQAQQEKTELKKINELKNDFIWIVSHDLRTPMSSIKWYLSMILDWDMGEISNELKNVLNIMYKNSESLLAFINDMLDITKLESWKMTFNNENIYLKDLFDEINNEIIWLVKQKNVNFEMQNSNQEIYVIADRVKLKQVLMNLIGNAIKFTPEWGNIILRNTALNEKKTKIEIIDTWIWIEPKDISKIFTKFGQIDNNQTRNQKWTGLGLCISREIVKHMWSDISVQSTIWEWSNFSFEIESL